MRDEMPVYSPYAGEEVTTPQRAAALYREVCMHCCWPRKTYPMLPWTMEQLVGSAWRNVHIGSLVQVVAIQDDHWDNPGLVYKSEHSWGELTWTLGLWVDAFNGGRYVIEHWIRVDLLSVEDQVRWFGFRLSRVNAQILIDSQRLDAEIHSGDKIDRRWREEDRARDLQEAAYAERQLWAFAQRAGLPLSAEIVNEWRSGNAWQDR